MATIENRSRYTVSVKNRADLYREFPFTQLKQAKQYAIGLGKDLMFDLSQKENAFLVRIIQQGYKPMRHTCRSLQEAEDAIARIEAERRTGLFIDYTKAHQVTFEDVLRRYMKEEGPKNKGWEKSEKYKCLGWLEDLDGVLAKRIAKKETLAAKVGRAGEIRRHNRSRTAGRPRGTRASFFRPVVYANPSRDARKSLRAGALCEKMHLASKNDYERAYFTKVTAVFQKMTTSVVGNYTNIEA